MMAKYKINFILRKDKAKSNGELPIVLTLSVSNQLKRLPTGVSVLPDNWDNEAKQLKFNKKSPLMKYEVDENNDKLNFIKKSVSDIIKRFILDNTPFSSSSVLEEYGKTKKGLTIKELPSSLVFDYIDRYINENKSTRAAGSLQVYSSLKSHLKNFEVCDNLKVRFSDINYNFFVSFQNYLIDKTSLNNVTIAKQISTLKTFLNYAKLQGITINEDYKNFKIRKQVLEVIALTQLEFDTLFDAEIPITGTFTSSDIEGGTAEKVGFFSLAKVRDLFCFSCTTGLRYSDLAQLRSEHIKPNEIKLTIKKTKEILTIPLNDYSYQILERYKNEKKPLPVISNQKYNKYLKALCEYLNIDEPTEIIRFKGSQKICNTLPKWKLISSHTGRKTFCTLSLEKGIPAETVMGISGHSDYKSFQRYVKITEERKRNEMAKAWGAPKKLKII